MSGTLPNPVLNLDLSVDTATGSTTARTLAARAADVINVKDFGAVGNGTTDSTAAFQAASARAAAQPGSVIYVPTGTYLVRATTFLPSNTTLKGDGWGSVLLADSSWPGGSLYQFVLNKNYLANAITDSDIAVLDLCFDYGTIGLAGGLPPSQPRGATHAVSCWFTRNVLVRNCLFQLRNHNDATALVGCDNTLVDGCSSYDSNNAAFDHWWGATNARVVNNFASILEGAAALFNPEGPPATPGWTATGFTLAGNHLACSGATPGVVWVGPIETGNAVSDVVIQGNRFLNVFVKLEGAVSNAVVTDNVFDALSLGAFPAIYTGTVLGGSPSGFVVVGNMINNPTSTNSIIVVPVDGAAIIGNVITGSNYGAHAGIDTGIAQALVVGNFVSNGVTNTTKALTSSSLISVPNGGGFSWRDSAGFQATWTIQSDNNHLFYGTGSTGAQRLIFGIAQRSDSSFFQIGPSAAVGFNQSNWLQVSGAASGSAVTLSAQAASDANVNVNITPKGTGALVTTVLTSTQVNLGTSASPNVRSGTGAASGTQPKGSLWMRTDGGVGTTMYVSQGAGVWNAVAAV